MNISRKIFLVRKENNSDFGANLWKDVIELQFTICAIDKQISVYKRINRQQVSEERFN